MKEFRCLSCNHILFKFEVEDKATIEIKCDKCNRFNLFSYNVVYITATNYLTLGDMLVEQATHTG